MVDHRFLASEFQARGVDTEEAQRLADLLAEEIQAEINQVVEPKMDEIADRLNKMGHNLKKEDPFTPGGYSKVSGEYSFRDDYQDNSGYHCKLRIALDTTISTGYAHMLDLDL